MKTLKFTLLVLLMVLQSSMAKAWDLELTGKVGNYPVVVQMNVPSNNNGRISGRYTFVSTLKRQGADKKSSWLYFESDNKFQNSYSVYDSNRRKVETWRDVSWDEYRNTVSFFGSVITSSNKVYKFDFSCALSDLSTKALSYLFDY